MPVRSIPLLACYVLFFFGCGKTEEQRATLNKDASAGRPVMSAQHVEEVLGRGKSLRASGQVEEATELIWNTVQDTTITIPVSGRTILLQELIGLHAGAGSTDGLIRAGELLLAGPEGLLVGDIADLKVKLGSAYFALGNARAFDYAQDAFTYFMQEGDRSRRAREALDLLVDTYGLTNEPEECIRLLEQEIQQAEEEGDLPWHAYLDDRLATVLSGQGLVKEAIAHRQHAMALLARMKVDGDYLDTLMQRRFRSASLEKNDPSVVGVEKGASPWVTASYRLLIPEQETMEHDLLTHLGTDHAETEQLDSALYYLERALAIAARVDVPGITPPHVELAEVLFRKGDLNAAVGAAEKGRALARSRKDLPLGKRAAEVSYRCYRSMGRDPEALIMLERVNAYADSLDQGDLRIALAKHQVAYEKDLALSLQKAELDKEEAEKELAQLESRNRGRIAIAAGGGGILLLAGLGAWFHTDRKRRKVQHEKEAATLETKALRSQMNPHFIFNALNSINTYVQQNDPDNASSFLTKFARVMRSVLENSRHSEVPLADDLDTLRGYIELERKRMQEKFDFTFEVDPDIDPEEVLVPPLVVQPFVENAIWHGMGKKEGKGHIILKVSVHGKQLRWTIEDDGVGRQAPKAKAPVPEGQYEKKTSLGTAITRSRLDLVQKQHGGKAGFHYEDLPVGTRVVVEIPLLLG